MAVPARPVDGTRGAPFLSVLQQPPADKMPRTYSQRSTAEHSTAPHSAIRYSATPHTTKGREQVFCVILAPPPPTPPGCTWQITGVTTAYVTIDQRHQHQSLKTFCYIFYLVVRILRASGRKDLQLVRSIYVYKRAPLHGRHARHATLAKEEYN